MMNIILYFKVPFINPLSLKKFELLSSQNVKELCNLGRFIKNAFDIRKLHT